MPAASVLTVSPPATFSTKYQSAPAVSAAAVKPASAPAKPASAPAAARPVPGPAAAKPASEQSAVKPAASAPAVRSVPNRTATMLGGVGPRTPAPAPVVEAPKPAAPKVEAAAADPLQAANDDWNLSFSDDALEASKPIEAPKPAAARPAPGLRSQTVRGGFDPKLYTPAGLARIEEAFEEFSTNTSKLNQVAAGTVLALEKLIDRLQTMEPPSDLLSTRLDPVMASAAKAGADNSAMARAMALRGDRKSVV